MANITFEVFFILTLILLNAMLSMSEFALISARKGRLQSLADGGDRRAQTAVELLKFPDRFLSTVQVGITLVGILAGAFGGATIAEQLASYFQTVPLLSSYSETISLALVVIVITYLSLVIGELVPKRVALLKANHIALIIAKPMNQLSKIAYPLVWLLSKSTQMILRPLGFSKTEEAKVSEEEVRLFIRHATQVGTIEKEEKEIFERVLLLGERSIASIMTPRPEIQWLDLKYPQDVNRRKIIESNHSRLPTGKGRLNEFQGVVETKDLLSQNLEGKPLDIESCLKQPLFVTETVPVLKALEDFKRAGKQIAMVVDEYGGISGLVTLNDLLQAVVGDLPTEKEKTEPQIVAREDGSWLVDGALSIYEFRNYLNIHKLHGEEEGAFHTVAGYVLTHMERLPTAGDHIEIENLRFEVVDMDGKRIDKVLVSPKKRD